VFLIYTGARMGEALWLNWRYIDLDARQVTLFGKSGVERGVPLHERVVRELRRLKHRDGEVFRRPDGMPYARPKNQDDTSAGSRIKTAFQAAVRRAGLTKVSPHICRHTWATWHYAGNRNLMALQVLGGWTGPAMVFRYTHINVGALQGTIDQLPGGELGDSETARKESA
jgi:integrase